LSHSIFHFVIIFHNYLWVYFFHQYINLFFRFIISFRLIALLRFFLIELNYCIFQWKLIIFHSLIIYSHFVIYQIHFKIFLSSVYSKLLNHLSFFCIYHLIKRNTFNCNLIILLVINFFKLNFKFEFNNHFIIYYSFGSLNVWFFIAILVFLKYFLLSYYIIFTLF